MKSNNTLMIAVLAVAVVILAVVVFDRRSRSEKATDSIREVGRDIKHAVDPRSPAEKIGDGIRDTAHEIKKD